MGFANASPALSITPTCSNSANPSAAPPRAQTAPAFNPLPLDLRLVSLAKSFTELQDARHQADYNTYRSYTRQEALHFHQLSTTALEDWTAIRRTSHGDAFLPPC